ncbi:MAG: hypothetical protein RLZZ414_1058 [Bacteroidota bacterium]|jgi:hypothetical protein
MNKPAPYLQKNNLKEIVQINIVSQTLKKGVKYYFSNNPKIDNKTILGLVVPATLRNAGPSLPAGVGAIKPIQYKDIVTSGGEGMNFDIRKGQSWSTSVYLNDVSVYVTIIDKKNDYICFRTPYRFFYECQTLTPTAFQAAKQPQTPAGWDLRGINKRTVIKGLDFKNVDWSKSYIEVFENTFENAPVYNDLLGNWVVPFDCFV